MGREQREQCIAEDLARRGVIEDEHYRVWLQRRRTGKSFKALRPMFRHSGSTLWKWYQEVQFAVEQEDGPVEDQGDDPLDGVTIHRNAAIDTDTPFMIDQCLTNLGI